MRKKFAFGLTFILSSLSYNSSASDTFPRHKFEAWFSTYGHHFEESSTIACNDTLQQYKNPGADSSVPRFSIAHHADCILANTTETIRANMASAGVMLGLMPSLISSLGPSLTEASTLLIERPFLSWLLAIGAPAFNPLRASDHQDQLRTIKQPFRALPRILSSFWIHVAISLLQYLLALAAAVNVLAASLELGLKTIASWKKEQSYLPLIWVNLSLVIHLCAMTRLRLISKKERNDCDNASSLSDIEKQMKSQIPHQKVHKLLIRLFIFETRLCVMRERYDISFDTETFLGHVLNAALPVLVVVHLFLGTMIFSSLLFIAVSDTWPIMLRYALSAAVAQLIRMFEIAGLGQEQLTASAAS
ncbi:hypothetical protein GJ744_004828 [Endocarpon pusillum]|uniref:ABC transmembrane type-1 domain-containing protein n=1 Tax=Endocarpon pusillum TaxID=364733 RepID=A0A8H7A5F2_9EURO|nr:hypothetical protein GJ744_004828 [Endocarpon pusillum]